MELDEGAPARVKRPRYEGPTLEDGIKEDKLLHLTRVSESLMAKNQEQDLELEGCNEQMARAGAEIIRVREEKRKLKEELENEIAVLNERLEKERVDKIRQSKATLADIIDKRLVKVTHSLKFKKVTANC